MSTHTYWQGTYHTFSLNKSHITILMVYKQPTTLRNAGYQIIYAPLSINKNARRGSVMPIIYTWKFLDFLFWANISANKSNRFFFVTYSNIVLLIFMNCNCSINVSQAISSYLLCTSVVPIYEILNPHWCLKQKYEINFLILSNGAENKRWAEHCTNNIINIIIASIHYRSYIMVSAQLSRYGLDKNRWGPKWNNKNWFGFSCHYNLFLQIYQFRKVLIS